MKAHHKMAGMIRKPRAVWLPRYYEEDMSWPRFAVFILGLLILGALAAYFWP